MTLFRWLLAPLLLTACAAAPPPTPPVASTTYVQSGFWRISSDQARPDAPAKVSAGGEFLELRVPVPRLSSSPSVDGCRVQTETPLAPAGGATAASFKGVNSAALPRPTAGLTAQSEPPFSHNIDAGEAVTLRSRTTGATIASIGKQVYTEGPSPAILYIGDALPPLPDHLTLVIPGAVGGYPAVSTELPDVPPPRLLAPADGRLVLREPIRWSDPTFDASGQVAFDILVQLQGDEQVVVFCNVEDDGSYTLSPELVRELEALRWTSGRILGTTRTLERLQYQGEALLLTLRSASVGYPLN
jgi:hypothetical protein